MLRESDQRVPVLGSIPIIGALFRSRATDKVKTNLLVFIRPKILRDAEQATIETNAKYNYIREVLSGKDGEDIQLMRGEDRFALPPFEEASGLKVGETPIINENRDADASDSGTEADSSQDE